ncbi:MAG: aminotransferase class III-fold pyridoxal phosphate-dependent enzyme, partial [Phycisphaerae bacterium]|nr:aminotransferase class III-fold pyridoxal phosphate-dependent enzyme [Phycisphaerae bacterium]
LAKAIGGGLPIGACVAAPKYADVLVPGTHGCTMGGNPLCAAAGAATMKLIEDENLLERAENLGQTITRTIREANISSLEDVRGAGVLIGMQFAAASPAKDIMSACMDRGLLVCVAKNNVLRLAPPLTITDAELDAGLEILTDVLKG